MPRLVIIAEAGVNHNGSIEEAKRLVLAAKQAGADIVKFQTFRADELVTAHANQARYQVVNTGSSESQHSMLKKLELSPKEFAELKALCDEVQIEFLSTAFDVNSLNLLFELGVSRLKIPSGEITNSPLLVNAAASGLPIILSTGMCTLNEISLALGALACGMLGATPSLKEFEAVGLSREGQKLLRERVTLLHCTTSYPAPIDSMNLRAMDTLREVFQLPVGLSDHSQGIHMAIAAAARGAAMLEKHYTLDRTAAGPDHLSSLEPVDLAEMIAAVRSVELALGDGVKAPCAVEIENLHCARKSLVAKTKIQVGELFSPANLAAKRPGGGISPLYYYDLLGMVSERSYEIDDQIVFAE